MFRVDFKYYKSKCPPPDLSQLTNPKNNVGTNWTVKPIHCIDNGTVQQVCGLKPLSEWQLYELNSNPGLLLIPNPFTGPGQRYWVCRCLRDYTHKPQRLNLDAHGDLKNGEEWWELCNKSIENKQRLLKKLRWATLGYHHNWDSKMYSEEAHDTFPADLATICHFVARVAGFEDFSAEAAIVNFYHMDSTLSGHTDHSEVDRNAPLMSFSFGQNAIFLIGGLTVEEKPTALLIESGDIVIMSGRSRLCYHGVPRIMPAYHTPWTEITSVEDLPKCYCAHVGGLCNKQQNTDIGCRKCEESLAKETINRVDLGDFISNKFDVKLVKNCLDLSFWEPFEEYLNESRINLNVRQVLHRGQNCL